jgi:ComF family protein
MLFKLKSYYAGLWELFFPINCLGCGNQVSQNHSLLCVYCRHQLPLTRFDLQSNHPMDRVFYGRIQIEASIALCYFKKGGIVQQLIHNLKYRGQQQVGHFFGEWLGNQMLASKKFDTIEGVVPVPLHPKRLRKRGYNQVSRFGKAIANLFNIPFYETILIRQKHTQTLVQKNRQERWKTLLNAFSIEQENAIENKHLLLVDDVLTTGATLEACAEKLQEIKGVQISIATMVFAQQILP